MTDVFIEMPENIHKIVFINILISNENENYVSNNMVKRNFSKIVQTVYHVDIKLSFRLRVLSNNPISACNKTLIKLPLLVKHPSLKLLKQRFSLNYHAIVQHFELLALI